MLIFKLLGQIFVCFPVVTYGTDTDQDEMEEMTFPWQISP